jgi:polyisoprenoid-binding protein YceI
MNMKLMLAAGAASLLAACAQPSEKAAETRATETAGAANLTVPAGVYELDPTHAILQWSVPHLGLSDYYGNFTKYGATVTLDPGNLENSKIALTIDPSGISTDYSGDYMATHANRGFASWDEEVAKGAQFMNSGKFPTITFNSTKVERSGNRTAKVTGDLTFLGVTKPVTLDVSLIGETANHPLARVPAFGVKAEGQIKRSDFGAKAGPQDVVKIMFNGEFLGRTPGGAAAGPGH